MKKILLFIMLITLNLSSEELIVLNADESVDVTEVLMRGNGEQCNINIEKASDKILKTNCIQLKNSKQVKIVCTKKKKMCKTEDELYEFIAHPSNPKVSSSEDVIVKKNKTGLPINIKQEMNYSKARTILLNDGWQSVKSRWQDIAEQNTRVQEFYHDRNWKEIETCSGTGMGYCIFYFIDAYGNKLAVVTAGEADDPSVDNWSFE